MKKNMQREVEKKITFMEMLKDVVSQIETNIEYYSKEIDENKEKLIDVEEDSYYKEYYSNMVLKNTDRVDALEKILETITKGI